jgi:heme oxygenase
LIGATRFLRHGAGLDLWTTFTAALSRIDNDPSAIDAAGEAARAAFSCFKAVTESIDYLSFPKDNQVRSAPT